MDEKDLHFCHDAAEAVVLGFQHYVLTLGITVLIPSIIVPQMGGNDVRIRLNFLECCFSSFLINLPTYLIYLRFFFSLQAEKARVIQTLLFVSGLSTLLQSLFGTRLPSVVVGSYSYIIPTTSIVLARRYNAYIDPHEVDLYTFLWLFFFFFFVIFYFN